TGTSGLVIKNAGGAGSLTSGNGMLVISAIGGGTTAPGAFTLAAPAIAGPYEYSLYQGSIDGTGPQNWYLRSDYVPEPLPPPAVPPAPPPPTSIPHYRQEVSLIAAIPPMAALYGRHMLETLHGRRGEPDTPPGTIDLGEASAGWGRALGLSGRHSGDPLGIYEGSEPSFEYTLMGLQAGQDLYQYRAPDGGEDVAGLYFGIGSAWGVVEHDLPDRHFDAGTTSLTAYSLGGYWTRHNADGAYLDAVVQATFYNFSTASRRVPDAHTSGLGLAASLEAGYPLNLGEGWILEPQAQGIVQLIDIEGFNDGSATVGYSGTSSLLGRVGVRLARSFSTDGLEDRPATIWGTVNLIHEFLGKPTTTFSSEDGPVPFTADLSDTRIQLGLGADITLGPSVTFFGQLGYDTTIDGSSNAVSARLGLKGRW
ncbi:MAG: autotransporter outer membrane beta-barrel domain-containing protein, partial [Devosia sp.]